MNVVLRRLGFAGALAAVSYALVVVVGWPDPGRSLDLITGRATTSATELAFIALLCWLVVAVVVVGAMITALEAARGKHIMSRKRWHSLALLAVVLIMLGIGVARHEGGYRVCCASQTTAQQVQSLVR